MSQTAELSPVQESSAARQQREGYPWLSFSDPQLEREFRTESLREHFPQVRQGLWLALLLVCAFGVMNVISLGAAHRPMIYWVELGLVLPGFLALIGITYMANASTVYPRIAEVLYPVLGVCLIAMEQLTARSGSIPVASWLVLVIPYTYSLLGLRLYPALRISLLSAAIYLFMLGRNGVVPPEVIHYKWLLVVVATVASAAMGLQLERLRRAHFLESRRLLEAAARDGLTGLFNRRRFDEHIDNCWGHAQRDGKLLAVLLVDIDSFKPYNDRYGHQAGDVVLRQVASALARSARRSFDFVARYGGEEFAVILFEPSREYVVEVAERIHAEVAALRIPHEASAAADHVTVSVGVAILKPSPDRSAAGGLQLADEALYAAKETGRKRTVYREAEYAALATGVFRRYRREAR